MGCRFCASTLDGLVRNLTPSEILDQIYAIERDTGEKVSNIVVMGTGEPMDNYDNLIRFIHLLTDKHGKNLSQRNITVSTCGIVPNMRRLAEEGLQITLALSLHAPNQKKRLELMPVANKYDIHEVVDACRYYFEKTGRRVTFEYSLVGGVNDSEEEDIFPRHKKGKIHELFCFDGYWTYAFAKSGCSVCHGRDHWLFTESLCGRRWNGRPQGRRIRIQPGNRTGKT